MQALSITLLESQLTTSENSSLSIRSPLLTLRTGSSLTVSKASTLALFGTALILEEGSSTHLDQDSILQRIGQTPSDVRVSGRLEARGSFLGLSASITFTKTASVSLQAGTRLSIFNLASDINWLVLIESSTVRISQSEVNFLLPQGASEILIRPPTENLATPPVVEVNDSALSTQRLTIDGPGSALKLSNHSTLAVLNLTVTSGAFFHFDDSSYTVRFSNPDELFSSQLLITRNSRMRVTGSDSSFPTVSSTTIEYESTVEVSVSRLLTYPLSRRVDVRHNSSFIINGRANLFTNIFPRYDAFSAFNSSSIQILGPRARLAHLSSCTFELNSNLLIAQSSTFACFGGLVVRSNSTIFVDDSRLEQSFGNITIAQYSSIIALNESEIILGGSNILIDASSKLVLETGSRLAGVGSISGLVLNTGGSITYENASTTTNFYIQNLTQSSSSTINTIIGANSSSTVVHGGTIHLGGSILVNISNNTLVTSNGVLLINAQDSLEGDIPLLQISLPNGTVVEVVSGTGTNQCGYSLQKREQSLFLIFSSSGCSSSSSPSRPDSGAVPSALGEAELTFSNNASAIAGGVIGGILGVAIIAVVIVFAVPSLRQKVLPFFVRNRTANANKSHLDMELTLADHTKSQSWHATKPSER